MLSQILRIASGYVDDVNDAVIGGGTASPTGLSKFAGQLGMEVELTQQMIKLKTPSTPVGPGKFMYVRLAPGASSPAAGATLNWDASVSRHLYQVTTGAGTAAGTNLTPSVTPGNYTLIQTSSLPPTGTITPLLMKAPEDEAEAKAQDAQEAEALAQAKAGEAQEAEAQAKEKAKVAQEAEADAKEKAKAAKAAKDAKEATAAKTAKEAKEAEAEDKGEERKATGRAGNKTDR
jgi:hypothetical protein